MKRFRDIIQDIKAPSTSDLWINNGELKYVSTLQIILRCSMEMMKKKQVVASYNREPLIENLWLRDGKLLYFVNGEWQPVLGQDSKVIIE